ncbi:MAG: adenine phosphoribosyltransferase [Bacteroidales bacterium]|nr:adenine phosphoribosyltransferase [Bacteroidales bacterium]
MKNIEFINKVKASIRDIKDFPKEGIVFKDLTTLFGNGDIFNLLTNHITNYYKNNGITKVVGIEARGFITAGSVANKLKVGFVPIRKKGKLPGKVYSKTYALEYGSDKIEIHSDAISPNDIVLLHDDVLATGGTMNAAIEMIKEFGVKKIYVNFICELTFLKGREVLGNDIEVYPIISY